MRVWSHVISAQKWETFRSIRLLALSDSPDAFGAKLEEVAQLSEAEWKARADGPGPTIVLYEDDRPVAMGGLFTPLGEEWAMVWGMWTAPDARGRGYGGSILRELIDSAQHDGRHVYLHVTEGNYSARDLYVRHGFETTAEWELLREDSSLRIEKLRLNAEGVVRDP